MTLAAILVVFFLHTGSLGGWQYQTAASPQSQTSNTSPEKPAAGSSLPSAQQQAPAAPVKKSHHKKKGTGTDCSSAPVKTSTANGTGATNENKATQFEQQPCPTPKVVVKNGGSNEPAVNLKGDSNASPGSTEDLMAAADDNLRKLAGRELIAGQQETVSKIKEFMNQAKAAVAAGDLERGHNLAVKARLLSDELVKP